MKTWRMEDCINAFFYNDSHTAVWWFGSSWPMSGDVITCKMQSGKRGKFQVEKFTNYSDPGDQTHLKVIFIGYEND